MTTKCTMSHGSDPAVEGKQCNGNYWDTDTINYGLQIRCQNGINVAFPEFDHCSVVVLRECPCS